MAKHVTIRDVAQHAGVSITTASFALNNVKGRVSEEVRQQVLKSAEELHYTINANAKNLRTSTSNTFLLVHSAEYLMERNSNALLTVAGGLKYANSRGKAILMNMLDTEAPMERELERFKEIWMSRRVDGMVFQCRFEDERDDVFYRELYRAGVNLINISRIGASYDYPCVYLEEFQITRDQVHYALKKDYHEIYYLCKKSRQPSVREQGFMDAIQGFTNVYEVSGEVLHYSSYDRTKNEIWGIVQPIIQRATRPVAFLCWSDVDAIDLISVLRAQGISVPGQVGVMGFDDILMAEHISPKLTTVSHPYEEMAYTAFACLEKAMTRSKDAPPDRILLPSVIIERESM